MAVTILILIFHIFEICLDLEEFHLPVFTTHTALSFTIETTKKTGNRRINYHKLKLVDNLTLSYLKLS